MTQDMTKEMAELAKKIGKAIQVRQWQKGFTVDELARISQMSTERLKNIILGNELATNEELVFLANCLDVTARGLEKGEIIQSNKRELRERLDALSALAQELTDAIAEMRVTIQELTGNLSPTTKEAKEKESSDTMPDRYLTGIRIKTPRGEFAVTDRTRKEMEEAGYGYHHESDTGDYLIMAGHKRAFAIRNENMNEKKKKEQEKKVSAIPSPMPSKGLSL